MLIERMIRQGPDFTRPKHKRTATGFGPGEIKNVESSIPEGQRAAWKKHVREEDIIQWMCCCCAWFLVSWCIY